MQKNILLIFLLLIFISCNQNKSTKSSDNTVNNENLSKAQENREDINNEFNQKSESKIENSTNEAFDKYFMSIEDSIVSLCCVDKLYNPFGTFNEKDISGYLPTYSITKTKEDNSKTTIFKKGNDSVSIVIWKSEYAENDFETFLGKGQLTDINIQLNNGIKIGMSKTKFMDNFFQFPDSIINKLNQISVCLDERGDSFTKYKFDNDTLSIIKFGEWEEYE